MDEKQKALLSSLYRNLGTPGMYRLKRELGKTADTCGIDSLLSFLKIAGAEENSRNRNSEFIVVTLFANTEKPGTETKKSKLPFERLLSRMYNDGTDSTRKSIERLIDTDIDRNDIYAGMFARLSSRAKKYLGADETIDYEKLLTDLNGWNISRDVRVRWASALFYTNKNNQ